MSNSNSASIRASGQLRAVFQSVDPETFLPPGVLAGFLPPEDGTGVGKGYIGYTIDARADLTTGTEIRNVALISFDGQEIIATNQINPQDPTEGTDPAKEALNTIDAAAPETSVDSLDAFSHPMFTVSWSGQDDAGGSGIASYDVFVAVDGGEYSLWLDDTTDTSASYTGEIGRGYAFYAVATDHVGQEEAAPPTADAQTFIVPPSDFDRDGDVDGQDFLIWQTNFPTESGATEDTGDADQDGDVDGEDFLLWQQNFGRNVLAGGAGIATDSKPRPVSRRWAFDVDSFVPDRRSREREPSAILDEVFANEWHLSRSLPPQDALLR